MPVLSMVDGSFFCDMQSDFAYFSANRMRKWRFLIQMVTSCRWIWCRYIRTHILRYDICVICDIRLKKIFRTRVHICDSESRPLSAPSGGISLPDPKPIQKNFWKIPGSRAENSPEKPMGDIMQAENIHLHNASHAWVT